MMTASGAGVGENIGKIGKVWSRISEKSWQVKRFAKIGKVQSRISDKVGK